MEEHTSTNLGSEKFLHLQDIQYTFNSSGLEPEEITYLCLRFGKGDSPETENPMLPFTVVGVNNKYDEYETPEALTICQKINTIGKVNINI